jgi:hypothetical protein
MPLANRDILNVLTVLSLLLCVGTCVFWTRSYRHGEHWPVPRFDHRTLRSGDGRLALWGPPSAPPSSALVAGSLNPVGAIRNDQIEWSVGYNTSWNWKVVHGDPIMDFPEGPEPREGSPAWQFEKSNPPSSTEAAILLNMLDRPDAFVAAHVLLTRRFNREWKHWENDDAEPKDIAEARARKSMHGHYQGLSILVHALPEPPGSMSGYVPFPCPTTIDPAQQGRICAQWHGRLDVLMFSVGWRHLFFATLVFPSLRGLIALRRMSVRRSAVCTNLCSTCGYDLRATPDRCPECGMVPDEVKA